MLGCHIDVTSRASVEAAFLSSGTPDILIANAGVDAQAALANVTEELWSRTLAINLGGVFNAIQAAATLMKPKRRGSIVLTASTNSYDGEAGEIAYNASKAGILGLLHTAANELGPYQIRVNAVCPGLIRTRLTEQMFQTPAIVRPYFQHIPLGRGGSPEEVANAMVFLASDLASFITGSTLFVDGGQMAAKFGTWNDEIGKFRDDHWELK